MPMSSRGLFYLTGTTADKTLLAPSSPGRGADRELASVKFEVLGWIAVQLSESHVAAEERVPARRVVHAPGQLPVGGEENVMLQLGDDSIELGAHPVVVEHDRRAARAPVVDLSLIHI